MNVKRYVIKNKKRSILIILGITLASSVLFSIGILTSMTRKYLIKSVKKEIGTYHVIIKGKIEKHNYISKIKHKDGRYFIIYKDIYKVYQNTEKLCHKNCESITYNEQLLALYGLSKNKNLINTLKKILLFFTILFGFIMFFIIYSSFKVSVKNRKEELYRLKLIGFTNCDLYKLFIKESSILTIIGITFGFILSLIINIILKDVINSLLGEILIYKMNISIYIPFIIVSIITMSVIVIISTIIPLKDIKKYSPMELFKKRNMIGNVEIKPFNNFILWLSLVNYKRSSHKYKSLIICTFISILSINVFFLCLNYSLKIIKEFVIIPKYDLYISAEGQYDYQKIEKDLKPSKTNKFSYCIYSRNLKEKMSKHEQSEDIMITNLGNDEVVNITEKVIKTNKIKKIKYQRFKEINEIILDSNQKIDNLKLTQNIPFGLENVDYIVLNLSEERFKTYCEDYYSVLIIKTKYHGIDKYINKIIKKENTKFTYLNVKKSRQLTENIILVLKIILYVTVFLITLVMITLTFNITASTIYYRKRELKLLNDIGLEKSKIALSLMIESLIVSLKGWLYTLPFILVINKFIYKGITEIFEYDEMILTENIFIISLVITFLIIYLTIKIQLKKL